MNRACTSQIHCFLLFLEIMELEWTINVFKVAKLREVRSLYLTISEAHRLPLKLVPNPYCVVSFNQVNLALPCAGVIMLDRII